MRNVLGRQQIYTINPDGTGLTLVSPDRNGNDYDPSWGTQTGAKANQTITFGALPSKTFGDSPFVISAAASSGLAVDFSAAGACSIAGNTVTILGAGTCAITASQPGGGYAEQTAFWIR
jgi:hypothetical protein